MQSTEDQDLARSRLQPGDCACDTVDAPGQTRALSRFCIPGGMACVRASKAGAGIALGQMGPQAFQRHLPLIPDQCVLGTTVGIQ